MNWKTTAAAAIAALFAPEHFFTTQETDMLRRNRHWSGS